MRVYPDLVLTHGERLLAAAEARARTVRARRRMLALGAPALLATGAALAALTRTQHARLSADGPHGLAHLGTHIVTIAFGVAFVALPLAGAVRARRALPAVVALLAGPVAMPMLFGGGGWRWWNAVIVAAVCALVSAGAMQRRAARGRVAQPAAT